MTPRYQWAKIRNYWWLVFLQYESDQVMKLDKASRELAYKPVHLRARGAT